MSDVYGYGIPFNLNMVPAKRGKGKTAKKGFAFSFYAKHTDGHRSFAISADVFPTSFDAMYAQARIVEKLNKELENGKR